MHHYPWRGRFQGEGCNPGGAGAAAACSALAALHGGGGGCKPPSDFGLGPQGAFGKAPCIGNGSLECGFGSAAAA